MTGALAPRFLEASEPHRQLGRPLRGDPQSHRERAVPLLGVSLAEGGEPRDVALRIRGEKVVASNGAFNVRNL